MTWMMAVTSQMEIMAAGQMIIMTLSLRKMLAAFLLLTRRRHRTLSRIQYLPRKVGRLPPFPPFSGATASQ